jgi:hypothetical protein
VFQEVLYGKLYNTEGIIVNSETITLYNEVKDVLKQINFKNEADDSIKNFRLSPPSEHEKQVVQAMEQFLNNDRKSFLNYRVGKEYKMPEVTSATYDKFQKKFQFYVERQNAALILRWAMLLHDIGKGRGVGEPHSEASAKIVHRIFQQRNFRNIDELEENEKKFVVWIVQHHDVMGNIYTGERIATYLNQITSKVKDAVDNWESLFRPEREKGLAFLQFSMLCDLRGTASKNVYGIYLTDKKANFWLKLSNSQTVEDLASNLYDHRIKKWTSGLDGSPNPQKKEELQSCIDKKDYRNKDKIMLYFGKKINYIVNGYYILAELASERIADLAELMERVIAGVDETSPQKAVRLEFTIGYRKGDPGSEEMLLRLKDALRGGNNPPLQIEYRQDSIIVHTKMLIDERGKHPPL